MDRDATGVAREGGTASAAAGAAEPIAVLGGFAARAGREGVNGIVLAAMGALDVTEPRDAPQSNDSEGYEIKPHEVNRRGQRVERQKAATAPWAGLGHSLPPEFLARSRNAKKSLFDRGASVETLVRCDGATGVSRESRSVASNRAMRASASASRTMDRAAIFVMNVSRTSTRAAPRAVSATWPRS